MESLSNDTLILITREKELDIKSFIMGFHEYRTIWKPQENEVLHACMEPTNKKDKFDVAVIGHKTFALGHLVKGKSGRFSKTIFYFLRTSEYHGCSVRVIGKAVNKGDDKSMKIQCNLISQGQSEFVDILSQERKKHMYIYLKLP